MSESANEDCVIVDKTIPVIDLDTTAEMSFVAEREEDQQEQNNQSRSSNGSSDNGQALERPLILIEFGNEEIFGEFGPLLKQFLKLRRKDFKIKLNEDKLELRVVDKKKQDDDMFLVDTTPSKPKQDHKVPRYRRLGEVLTDRENLSENEGKGIERYGMSCFNCDGNHNLRDCKEPKNYQKINRNRRNMSSFKSERYHVDLPQKYGYIRPGEISAKLRKALSLKPRELPVHIYKMRQLGYPPGWLEEAKVSHSGMNLIGSDGNPVLESDDEEGEVDQVKDKYDATKIIDYPGFNVEPDQDSVDNAKRYNCPPMSDLHKKEEFFKILGVNVAKAYKRRQMKSFPMNESNEISQNSVIPEDMDLEEGEEVDDQPPPPITEEFRAPLPPEPISNAENEEEPPTKVPRLSLEKGAEQADDSLVNFILERDANESLELKSTGPDQNTSSSKTVQLESKSAVEGTPILKSVTPFVSLPPGENWAKGVSDVLNFENLPDSVGKYEKMKEIIKKVQITVKKLHSD